MSIAGLRRIHAHTVRLAFSRQRRYLGRYLRDAFARFWFVHFSTPAMAVMAIQEMYDVYLFHPEIIRRSLRSDDVARAMQSRLLAPPLSTDRILPFFTAALNCPWPG